jgi:hypothetical protein
LEVAYSELIRGVEGEMRFAILGVDEAMDKVTGNRAAETR